MMHVMRCAIILDPDSFDSPDISINCRFEAKRESAEYRVVCRSVAINTAVVGIGVIRISMSISSISSSPPSAVAPPF